MEQMTFLSTIAGHSQATKAKTSGPSSAPSVPSATVPLMFLDLRTGAGNLLGAYWETDTALPGESTTPSTGACPNAVRESTLSQILDLNAPEKYSLSPTACAGIIRRAEKRGKELPDMLKEALMEVIGLAGGLNMIEDDPKEAYDDECEGDEE